MNGRVNIDDEWTTDVFGVVVDPAKTHFASQCHALSLAHPRDTYSITSCWPPPIGSNLDKAWSSCCCWNPSYSVVEGFPYVH